MSPDELAGNLGSVRGRCHLKVSIQAGIVAVSIPGF
jgi:hypothetical protein